MLDGDVFIRRIAGENIRVDAFDTVEVRVFLTFIPLIVAVESDELIGFPGFEHIGTHAEDVVHWACALVGGITGEILDTD